MSLSRPSYLMHFLQEMGMRPQKKWSQNFLVDGNIIRKIVHAAGAEKGDLILEIGPGPGALTEALLAQGCSVAAVEKDPGFADALMRLEKEPGTLSVFKEDILDFPIEKFLQEKCKGGKKVKVVSNLPYHITTPIALKLLPLHAWIESITIMVQREVALRICAKQGSSDYSSLSLFTQFYCSPHYCFTVPPTCFFPQPKVHSAVVTMNLKEPPLPLEKEEAFFKITRTAFQHRRKMLRSSLKELYSKEVIASCLAKLNIEEARPEELSLDQFLLLFNELSRSTGKLPD
ncbi:MAG: ribosomal RNA small subunit methyltransferase A [Chlamydiales bacterium]|nr:ribosomal RNA small subunit methyltransferase A [Chlamydiales bacterium]